MGGPELKLFDWQEADQQTLARHNWTAPVSAEPGSGKTIIGVASGLRSGARTKLIIAPQGTHADYGDTINALASPNDNADIFALRNDTVRGKRAWDELRWGMPGWYFVTPQLFARSDWKGIAPDLAVADESHLLLGWDTASRKRLIGQGRLDPKTGLRAGALVAGMRLAMSGTPVRNKFENWYALARFIYPERYGPGDIADASRADWLDRHMVSEVDPFSCAHGSDGSSDFMLDLHSRKRMEEGRPKEGDPYRPRFNHDRCAHKKYLTEKNPGGFVASLPVVIQHLRRETCCSYHPGGFLAHLPEPAVVREAIELLPAQKKAVSELEDQYVTWLADNPLIVELPVTLQQRIRQLTLGVPTVEYGTREVKGEERVVMDVDFADDAASPKIERAIEILTDEMPDEKAVVFTSSRKFARVAALRLRQAGINAEEYSGAIPDKRREQLRADFKSGDLRVMVTVIAAGGTGLNLQYGCALEVWLDTDADGTTQTQAESRVDRLGQTEQVTRYYLHDSLGVDEGLFGRNLEKRLELNRSNRRRVGA